MKINPETVARYINEIKIATYPQLIPNIDELSIDGKSILRIKIQEYPIKPVSFKSRYGDLKLSDLERNDYASSLRNKLLAEAFYLTGDIEKYGTGFVRIREQLKDYPEIRLTAEQKSVFKSLIQESNELLALFTAISRNSKKKP